MSTPAATTRRRFGWNGGVALCSVCDPFTHRMAHDPIATHCSKCGAVRIVWAERASRTYGECDGSVAQTGRTWSLDVGTNGLVAIVADDRSWVVADSTGFSVMGRGRTLGQAKRDAAAALSARVAALGGGS